MAYALRHVAEAETYKSASINVFSPPPGRPAFSASLPAVDVSSGESAVFTCSVVSNPPATVSWASGTPPQTLSSNGRITISNTTLTINNVQAVDEGFYECIAVNSFGQNSTSGRLTITGNVLLGRITCKGRVRWWVLSLLPHGLGTCVIG